MKQVILPVFLFLFFRVFSQDTFSIVAVDSITGEAGGAGASCIDDIGCGGCGGVIIINDLHPGTGVIHTQSYYLAANQNYARALMNSGFSPSQIVDSLIAKDAQNNPSIRQYGIVDLYNNSPRSAAYTGTNCMDYKNHIVGKNYSIQGNILLGKEILDSMEAKFLSAEGDLACKLMAALQGAKVVGADTRCMSSGNSSLSAFLRVAKPADIAPDFYLNLNVKSGPPGFEPIDSLQILFDLAHSCLSGSVNNRQKEQKHIFYPNPTRGKLSALHGGSMKVIVVNMLGEVMFFKEDENNEIDISHLPSGIYFAELITRENVFVHKIILQ
jgi:uncharacterized Ntn-hydrolase superfamily protein